MIASKSRYETRIKIVNFLRKNKNNWFSHLDVAMALDKRSIAYQIDAAVANNPNLYCDKSLSEKN